MIVVPGSSANLGPGFDVLAMAVDLTFELSVGDHAPGLREGDRRWLVCEPTHPASVAWAVAAGRDPEPGTLWWRSGIPPGRGLGFSGAARVAGAAAALLAVTAGADPIDDDLRHRAFAVAAALEGHPDNAAASTFGGVVAAAAGRVVPIPVASSLGDLVLVAWSPDTETSTDRSRAALPVAVPFADAVFNVGRAALLVAALGAGDRDALRDATADRLHQDRRLERVPAAAAALAAALDGGAVAAWLSGSGPTVAALVDRFDAPALSTAIEAAVASPGVLRILGIDHGGVRGPNDS